jgi:hypothetical protein
MGHPDASGLVQVRDRLKPSPSRKIGTNKKGDHRGCLNFHYLLIPIFITTPYAPFTKGGIVFFLYKISEKVINFEIPIP